MPEANKLIHSALRDSGAQASENIKEELSQDDLELLSVLREKANATGFSLEQITSSLRGEASGVSAKVTLDGKLEVERRSPTNRRFKRKTTELNDPTRSANSEVNRRDKRIVAKVPKRLVDRFHTVLHEQNKTIVKVAFYDALVLWLTSDHINFDANHQLMKGEEVDFQTRIEVDELNAFVKEAKRRGIKKKYGIAEVLYNYVASSS